MATVYGTCPVAPGYWGPAGKLASFPWLLPLPSQTPGCDAAQRIEKTAESSGWSCMLENWMKAMVFLPLLTVNGPYCAHFLIFLFQSRRRVIVNLKITKTFTFTFYMFEKGTNPWSEGGWECIGALSLPFQNCVSHTLFKKWNRIDGLFLFLGVSSQPEGTR